MTTRHDILPVERQVLDVFSRCRGIFGNHPKRDTERTLEMIRHNILTHGSFYSQQAIADAVESLIENGLLDLNESTGHFLLTDEGYHLICDEMELV